MLFPNPPLGGITGPPGGITGPVGGITGSLGGSSVLLFRVATPGGGGGATGLLFRPPGGGGKLLLQNGTLDVTVFGLESKKTNTTELIF